MLVVFPSFNWCKRSTCTGGGCHQLQLTLVVLFHLATGADSLLIHMVYMNIIGASLSEPHMYEKYGERVCIYIYISSALGHGTNFAGCKMDNMAALCVAIACDSNNCRG